jgi:hypothetical protein
MRWPTFCDRNDTAVLRQLNGRRGVGVNPVEFTGFNENI